MQILQTNIKLSTTATNVINASGALLSSGMGVRESVEDHEYALSTLITKAGVLCCCLPSWQYCECCSEVSVVILTNDVGNLCFSEARGD